MNDLYLRTAETGITRSRTWSFVVRITTEGNKVLNYFHQLIIKYKSESRACQIWCLAAEQIDQYGNHLSNNGCSAHGFHGNLIHWDFNDIHNCLQHFQFTADLLAAQDDWTVPGVRLASVRKDTNGSVHIHHS